MQSSREVYADDPYLNVGTAELATKASPLRTNPTRLTRALKLGYYLPVTGKPSRDEKPALLLFPCV